MAKAGTKPTGRPKKKISKAEQSRRFIEAARKLGANEDPEAFDRVFKKLNLKRWSGGNDVQ
jgi:hypothetical protein